MIDMDEVSRKAHALVSIQSQITELETERYHLRRDLAECISETGPITCDLGKVSLVSERQVRQLDYDVLAINIYKRFGIEKAEAEKVIDDSKVLVLRPATVRVTLNRAPQ